MINNILTIVIHKPVNEVFTFTTDPHNTSKWIDDVVIEKTNQWPPQVGTIYENRGKTDAWSVYHVTKYDKDKEFELVKQDGSTYHVNYKYHSMPGGATKLVYHEWVIKGVLDQPFTQNTLVKLKAVIESKVLSRT